VKENNYDIEELIGKVLSEEATAEERILVSHWRAASPDNEKYFHQLKAIFENTSFSKSSHRYNADAAWEKVKSRIDNSKGIRTIPLHPEIQRSNLFLKIAASLLLVIGAAYLFNFYRTQNHPASLEVMSDNKTTADTLPDGTDVFLNRRTTLAYEFDKKKNAHVVKLKGEAYFKISHNDDKKFIVETQGVFIRDIGTSFNVKAYPDSDLIEVVVEEGDVMFFSDTDSGVYLKANGKGIYNKKTKTFTVAAPEENVTAYKTRFFVFSDIDLASAVKDLNDVYGEKITLDESLKRCRVTVNFNDESIEEIAAILAETLNLEADKRNGIIHLYGTGCEEQ